MSHMNGEKGTKKTGSTDTVKISRQMVVWGFPARCRWMVWVSAITALVLALIGILFLLFRPGGTLNPMALNAVTPFLMYEDAVYDLTGKTTDKLSEGYVQTGIIPSLEEQDVQRILTAGAGPGDIIYQHPDYPDTLILYTGLWCESGKRYMVCPLDFARNEQEGASFYVRYQGDLYGGACPFDVYQNNPWEGEEIRLEGRIVETEGIPTEELHSNNYSHTTDGAKLYSWEGEPDALVVELTKKTWMYGQYVKLTRLED